MKKVLALLLVLVLAIGMFAACGTDSGNNEETKDTANNATTEGGNDAVDLVPTSESLLQKVEKKNEVRTELPQAVKSAVISKYVAYAIEQFSFEENSVYKLILKGDRNKLIVYYTADGEYLRQETVKTVQMVALI